MRKPIFLLILTALFSLSLWPLQTRAQSAGSTAFVPDPAPPESDGCELLGPLTASVDCDCYDEMSYDKVESDARRDLLAAARGNYPESNRVQVWSVELYLNLAVAKGAAYRCPTLSSI